MLKINKSLQKPQFFDKNSNISRNLLTSMKIWVFTLYSCRKPFSRCKCTKLTSFLTVTLHMSKSEVLVSYINGLISHKNLTYHFFSRIDNITMLCISIPNLSCTDTFFNLPCSKIRNFDFDFGLATFICRNTFINHNFLMRTISWSYHKPFSTFSAQKDKRFN